MTYFKDTANVDFGGVNANNGGGHDTIFTSASADKALVIKYYQEQLGLEVLGFSGDSYQLGGNDHSAMMLNLFIRIAVGDKSIKHLNNPENIIQIPESDHLPRTLRKAYLDTIRN
jgi:hypothetical protein